MPRGLDSKFRFEAEEITRVNPQPHTEHLFEYEYYELRYPIPVGRGVPWPEVLCLGTLIVFRTGGMRARSQQTVSIYFPRQCFFVRDQSPLWRACGLHWAITGKMPEPLRTWYRWYWGH